MQKTLMCCVEESTKLKWLPKIFGIKTPGVGLTNMSFYTRRNVAKNADFQLSTNDWCITKLLHEQPEDFWKKYMYQSHACTQLDIWQIHYFEIII